jgi:hypothetical protein
MISVYLLPNYVNRKELSHCGKTEFDNTKAGDKHL